MKIAAIDLGHEPPARNKLFGDDGELAQVNGAESEIQTFRGSQLSLADSVANACMSNRGGVGYHRRRDNEQDSDGDSVMTIVQDNKRELHIQ